MGLRSGNQYSLNQLICPFFLLLCFLISRLHTDLGFIFFFFRSRLSSYRSVCHIFTWKMSCSTDLPVLIELHFSFIFGRLCLCLEDQQSQLMKPTFLSMSFMLSVCRYWVFFIFRNWWCQFSGRNPSILTKTNWFTTPYFSFSFSFMLVKFSNFLIRFPIFALVWLHC